VTAYLLQQIQLLAHRDSRGLAPRSATGIVTEVFIKGVSSSVPEASAMHGIERCRGRRGESVVGFLNLPSPIHLLLVKHQPAKSCRLALKSRIVSWRLEGHFTAVKTRTMMPSLHLNLGQTSDVTFSAIWGYFRPSRYLPSCRQSDTCAHTTRAL
jgi:hypothetical protein